MPDYNYVNSHPIVTLYCALTFKTYFAKVITIITQALLERETGMLQLINTSSYVDDCAMWRSWGGGLEGFLADHGLDGVEAYRAMTGTRRSCLHGIFAGCICAFGRHGLISGVATKRKCCGSLAAGKMPGCITVQIVQQGGWRFGGAIWRRPAAAARYVVLHVAHVRQEETGHWRFSASDEEVVTATLELVRLLVQELPASVALLFENLWWPGLRRPSRVWRHCSDGLGRANAGIMLDTGYLMNTCQELVTSKKQSIMCCVPLTRWESMHPG